MKKSFILSIFLFGLVIGIVIGFGISYFQMQPTTYIEIENESTISLATESETIPQTLPPTESETIPQTLPPTEPETEIMIQPITDSSVLLPYLETDDRTIDDIPETEQLIVVTSSGSYAEIALLECNSGIWEKISETSGVVGKNGISAESREGDYRTPKGIFPLGIAFGTENIGNLSIEYRQLNENCYWVDDPESEYYNQWVETDVISWKSAEHLLDYPSAYHYAVAINYNMNPVVPYAGSAIFLHCQTGDYTAGCVAVPAHEMVFILNWLDASRHPTIWIQ